MFVNGHPGQSLDVARQIAQPGGIDAEIDIVEHAQSHHQFVEAHVSSPLSEAVDRRVETQHRSGRRPAHWPTPVQSRYGSGPERGRGSAAPFG